MTLGCGFNDVTPLPGCFDIAVTIKVSSFSITLKQTNRRLIHRLCQLFNLFNPTPEEQKTGLLSGGITWDLCVQPLFVLFYRPFEP